MATRTAQSRHHYVLTLFVAGATPAALHAIEQIHLLSQDDLGGDLALRVIDLGEHPEEGVAFDVIATPTLVRELPLPVKMLVGRLAADRLLAGIRVDLLGDDAGTA